MQIAALTPIDRLKVYQILNYLQWEKISWPFGFMVPPATTSKYARQPHAKSVPDLCAMRARFRRGSNQIIIGKLLLVFALFKNKAGLDSHTV